MKTILIDNSLCVFTLRDDVNPEYVYRYIASLGESGVRYVELDFRAAMCLRELPDNMKYVFRLLDPMFMKLCEVYDFDYIHLTLGNLKHKVKTDIPIMLGLPSGDKISAKFFYLAKRLVGGDVTAVRLRESFPVMPPEKMEEYVSHLKNTVPVPIDICPMNAKKTALDAALKLTQSKVDTLTLTLGKTDNFCGLQDYFFALLMMFNKLPPECSLSALCRAAVYHRYIFKDSGDFITDLFKLFERDGRLLTNADSGGRVGLKMGIRNPDLMSRRFETALEKMAESEEIPDDIFACIDDAIKCFDVSLYERETLNERKQAFLN